MAKSFSENSINFPLRFWVIDNSGSMQKTDGHVILESSNTKNIRFSNCTRWDEIKETVNYHIRLASLLELPTSFRVSKEALSCFNDLCHIFKNKVHLMNSEHFFQ